MPQIPADVPTLMLVETPSVVDVLVTLDDEVEPAPPWPPVPPTVNVHPTRASAAAVAEAVEASWVAARTPEARCERFVGWGC